MINQVSDGLTVLYTASADIASGDLVHLGTGLCGVAVNDIANGATGAVALTGVYEVLKVGTTAIAVGAIVKLGTAGNTVVAITTADQTIGSYLKATPVEASTTAMTTVKIKLGV